MNIVDIWTTLASIASIASLFLVLTDKYPDKVKYFKPATWVLAGFAFGRVSFALTPGINRVLIGTHTSVFILILLSFLALTLIAFIFMMKHEQPGFAYVILILIPFFVLPRILDTYSKSNPIVQTGDFVQLAKVKETNGDYDSAIRYLKIFAERINDDTSKEQVREKIKLLRQRQIPLEKKQNE